MTVFYLIRHGSCDGLGAVIWGRTPGIFLNDEGKAQAQQLAEHFSEMKLDAIYSSPLERARQTAEAIACTAQLEVQEAPAFNEIDFGELSGKSFEVLAHDERWQRFHTQRSITRIPGGELFIEAQARAICELELLCAHHPDARVAIVSHSDLIKCVVGYVAGIPIDLLQRIEISPCSVSTIAIDEHEARLLGVNNRGELI